jgi:RNA polymerase sigma-70 factor (ECF subfamily)
MNISNSSNPLLARAAFESSPTRSSLLLRLRDIGDEASWRVFFDTYWRLLYNVARKTGLSDPDAQDVVQETVIAVARKIPEFVYDPGRGSFKQWLLLITRRRIQDHFRKTYRSLPVSELPQGDQSDRSEREAPAEYLLESELEAAWESEWRENILQCALARVRERVNPKQYQVFDYCVLQTKPVAETARMLGLNAAQVYLAKHRVYMAVKRAVTEIERELQHAH